MRYSVILALTLALCFTAQRFALRMSGGRMAKSIVKFNKWAGWPPLAAIQTSP